ncbi:MAG TPA: aminotransferase class IV [Pyrinomonadaceae bacterium]|jgi:branched-subunit amino acid aminotransferase/4-amino-4-deoxychorismate lyase
MHQHVILNRRLLEARRARLRAVTSAALYGRGVFTTIAVHAGRPFLWDAHWSRLLAHAERAGVVCDYALEEAARLLARLVESNGVGEGRARVHLLARPVRGRWKLGHEGRASDLLMMTADAWPAPEALALTVSPYRVNTSSPLVGVKTVGRLEQVLAWEEARARDFDEAVVCNERGEVACATTANIFWVKHGTVYTPALATGAVAGTTRARVIELAAEMAVPLSEGAHTLHDMADADEVFLTSAALGVALVTAFDFRRYTIPVGSPALRLREAYRQLTLAAAADAGEPARGEREGD